MSIQVANGSTAISSIALTRDALGRVISAVRSAPTVPNVPTGYLGLAYDAASQSYASTYDALGRATQDALAGRTYTWDLASRLTSYSGSNGSSSFTYDAFGQRTSSTTGGVTQNFVLNYALPLPSIATVQTSGADLRYYIWLPNGTLLESIEAAGNARHFYHFDESGTTNFLTTDTGAVTDSYATTPYGETIVQTGSTPNPFTFQGAFGVMQEGATGLYYMRARYYDSASARFLSRDPVVQMDPRALSPYQFARANPVEGADPTGRDTYGNFSTFFIGAFFGEGGLKAVGLIPDNQSYFDGSASASSHPFTNADLDQLDFGGAGPVDSIFGNSIGEIGSAIADAELSLDAAFDKDFYNDPEPTPIESGGTLAPANTVFKSASTTLLFPYTTNANGFETAIAIANTAKDPFKIPEGGTPSFNQSGVIMATYLAGGSHGLGVLTDIGLRSTWAGLLANIVGGLQLGCTAPPRGGGTGETVTTPAITRDRAPDEGPSSIYSAYVKSFLVPCNDDGVPYPAAPVK